jgi:dolichol-phosphate mannosyltransferase
MKLLIILPTLNEKNNINYIVNRIFFLIKSTDILFVDDNSSDGSKEIIKKLNKKNKKIFYIFRKKKYGIGSAHKIAFHWAKKHNYGLCATMDCDRTHDPYYLKKMLNLIRKDYAIINTNRFKTLNNLEEWSFFRKILTKMRFFFVKLLLRTKLDSSGGLRMYNLKKIDFKHFFLSKNNSYFFLIESLFFFEKLNYKIFEIPIILKKRTYEKSKIKIKDVLYSFFSLIKLSFCNNKKI